MSKITQEFALSGDARALLFSRGAVIVSGPTEQGALPIWCAKSKAAEELGAPAARDIVFYSAPGDSGFRTILSVLHGFGIPWVVVCDGKSFRRRDQLEQPHLPPDRAGRSRFPR